MLPRERSLFLVCCRPYVRWVNILWWCAHNIWPVQPVRQLDFTHSSNTDRNRACSLYIFRCLLYFLERNWNAVLFLRYPSQLLAGLKWLSRGWGHLFLGWNITHCERKQLLFGSLNHSTYGGSLRNRNFVARSLKFSGRKAGSISNSNTEKKIWGLLDSFPWYYQSKFTRTVAYMPN